MFVGGPAGRGNGRARRGTREDHRPYAAAPRRDGEGRRTPVSRGGALPLRRRLRPALLRTARPRSSQDRRRQGVRGDRLPIRRRGGAHQGRGGRRRRHSRRGRAGRRHQRAGHALGRLRPRTRRARHRRARGPPARGEQRQGARHRQGDHRDLLPLAQDEEARLRHRRAGGLRLREDVDRVWSSRRHGPGRPAAAGQRRSARRGQGLGRHPDVRRRRAHDQRRGGPAGDQRRRRPSSRSS